MDELTLETATALAKKIRAGESSPLTVAEAFLSRIERLNPGLNAVVTLAPTLLDDARQAEAALKGGLALGPLHGVPFTVKDTIATAGVCTTSGSLLRSDYVPNQDAPAVARMKAAGAILLGKTNTAEMAMEYTADNPVFGRTNNPHDPARTPGGSSGGEAAAIASTMSPLGLGSDLAGSIRIPAHFCGITGFRPATASVPGGGQMPPATGPYSLGSAIGPLARTIEDLELAFNVLAAIDPGPGDHPASPGLRIAFYTDDGISPVTSETRAAVKAAAVALAEAGFEVEEQRPPGVERALDLWLSLFSRASVVFLRQMYSGNEEKAGSFIRWRLNTADAKPPQSVDDYIGSWLERDRLRANLIEWMKDRLLLAPVGACPALEHDSLKVIVNGEAINAFRAFSYSQAFNAFDLPAVTVPAGRSNEGLPIGVQVVGRPGDEKLIFAAAKVIENACGGWQRPAFDHTNLEITTN
ncbi:MAG TPA: amidase [Pyrinomonadaceae bacterium]|nr:amidase [Pyrinomonadaceae bacterium]